LTSGGTIFLRLNARSRAPFHLAFALVIGGVIPVSSHAVAGKSDDYLNELVAEAQARGLHQDRYWHLLLHYKKTLFGAVESQEDAPEFFTSPLGKSDPQAELVATIKSFFRPLSDLKPGEEHPQCVFPARYKWLDSRLSFDPARLTRKRCERLESWLEDLAPEKITLVFASHYLNNPGSMFGHTLLRIDKKREGPEQKLLNYGVNYAAAADTDNPLVYTVKGLFGGFKGVFSLYPYYVKVQEYNNLENRDLWEYELNFTEDQMNYLLLHLWELGGNYFDYWYFQENCAYHLLSLLEVANPDLHLTDQFTLYTIPGETVKAVTAQKGLVSRRVYRPSLLSQMNQKRLRMSDEQSRLFDRLVKDPEVVHDQEYLDLRVPDKALILDAYLDYAQYRNMRDERTAAVIDPVTRRMLVERSQLNYRATDHPETVYFSSPPELGHGSARIGASVGRNAHESFEEISMRPAFHDLLASDTGYGRGSQILFLDGTVRRYNDSGETKIDNLKLIDLASLTPYDSLLSRNSWTASVGIDTIRDLNLDCRYCNSFKGDYGFGRAYSRGFSSPGLAYALINVELELSPRLDHDYRFGGGPTLGLLYDLTSDWRIQITGSYLDFPFGQRSHYAKTSVAQRYSLSQNLDVRAYWNRVGGNNEGWIGINYYF
jgi:hypothetical protein